MDKKVILLIVAAVCITLYFYGQHIKKDSEVIKWLPAAGSLAFGINTLIQIAH